MAFQTLDTFDTFRQDPDYQEALQNFQRGSWKTGLTQLNDLMEKYPLEHELRQLRQEMLLRAKVDSDEAADRKLARRRRLKSLALRAATLIVLAGLAFFALRTYSDWFQKQLSATMAETRSILEQAERKADFDNGLSMLRAGRLEDARVLLEKVQAKQAGYPGLAEALSELERKSDLKAQYDEAVRLYQSGDLPAALTAFEAIENQDAYYEDVSIQIKNIQDQFQLGDFFTRAEEAYAKGDWEVAVTGYEDVRRMAPAFNQAVVEDRLYESYIKAAEMLLVNEPESLDALQRANDYFQAALALKPQDEETRLKRAEAVKTLEDRLVRSYVDQAQEALAGQADSLVALAAAQEYLLKALKLRPEDEFLKAQVQMAVLYQDAQDQFNRGNWDQVITDLEFVYGLEPDFASGTARQTLYEAYIARGDSRLASGSPDAALTEYQRAAVLAEDSKDFSEILVYEAQVKVANVLGILGRFEEAARVYLSAVEAINLAAELKVEQPNLALKLRDAEAYLDRQSYRNAYKLFKDVAAYSPKYTLMAYELQEGEYITQILNRYNTTMSALTKVNEDVNSSNRSNYKGQILLIPVRSDPQNLSVPTPTPQP